MQAHLRVVAGAKASAYRLKLPTTIGRGQQASLRVPHSQVSREHCEIYEEDGLLVVDDLGSANGTFINDERIGEPTFLYPGELLRVGQVVLRAEYEAAGGLRAQQSGSDAPERLSEPLPTVRSEPTADRSALDPSDVLNDDGPPPGPVSSIVQYRETESGSFLGIEELITESPASEAEDASRPALRVDEPPPPQVDAADSGLNEFFKNIE